MMEYCIVSSDAKFIGAALKRLTDAINMLHREDGWCPMGAPNVKRDSTQMQMFIAFQLMRREINENNNSRE